MTIRRSKRSSGKTPSKSDRREPKRHIPEKAQELDQLERMEYDLSSSHITSERFQAARELINACEKVGVLRLKLGKLTDDAGHYVGELALELAHVTANLVELGDLMLARRLPRIVEAFRRAESVYGSKITGRVEKRISIERILEKHKARALLEMVSALHSKWETLLHIPNRREIQSLSERDLRKLLVGKERWFQEADGTEEWRPHRLAQMIENIVAIREGESENINLFVEYLWRGWFWGGPKRTFAKCDWHGDENMPSRDNVNAWMKIVMPFLRRETNDDAMKLSVFARLLASRRYVYAGGEDTGGRLAGDSTTYIWNQMENRIRKAWRTMATRHRKHNFKKPA